MENTTSRKWVMRNISSPKYFIFQTFPFIIHAYVVCQSVRLLGLFYFLQRRKHVKTSFLDNTEHSGTFRNFMEIKIVFLVRLLPDFAVLINVNVIFLNFK